MGYICICVCVCVYGIYICVCVYIHIYVVWYLYVCVYIYIPYTHNTHNEILLSHKKGWNFAICRDMNGLGRHYAKWNKSDRERQILYNITYMWNLKNSAN